MNDKPDNDITINPSEILLQYRKHSPKFVTDQIRSIKKLSQSDQMELLFHMIMHNAMAIAALNRALDAPEVNFVDDLPNPKPN